MKPLFQITLYSFLLLLAFRATAQESIDTAHVYRSISEASIAPEKVFKLSLKNVRLDSIPAVVFQMTNLRYLDLSRTHIDTLPPGIGALTSLTYLNLSNNRLSYLPDSIGELTQLKYLGLNRNLLRQLPNAIGNLASLEVLELWDNELEEVPDDIGRLQELKVLELRGILFSDEQQAHIDAIVVKSAKVNMSPSCNCKN